MYSSEDVEGWVVNIEPEEGEEVNLVGFSPGTTHSGSHTHTHGQCDSAGITPVRTGPVAQARRQCDCYEDKEHKCQYPGCFKAFYHKQHLRRHETVAHGRVQRRTAKQAKTPQQNIW